MNHLLFKGYQSIKDNLSLIYVSRETKKAISKMDQAIFDMLDLYIVSAMVVYDVILIIVVYFFLEV